MAQLILAAGRETALARRHPWLFAGAVAQVSGRLRSGDTVEVLSHEGQLLGRAAWSPSSQIRARMWSFDPTEPIDDAFFRRRVAQAVARRASWSGGMEQDAVRLVHAESDGLPGVVADRYGDTVVLQLTSAGADKWRQTLVSALIRATGCHRVYERSDVELRRLEGLEPVSGLLHGEPLTEPLLIAESGLRMGVDVLAGHKTGFYLDQRDNRRLLATLAEGRRVLNCFCYTGGFSLHALAGGASQVVSIDSSGPALLQAQANLALNPDLPADRAHWQEADVFEALRAFRQEGRLFDLIVLDPPKFAPSPAHAQRAARAYKDINWLALQLLAPGGRLMTFSCSGGVSSDLFQKIVAGAALDAGRDARIVQRLTGAADHPVALSFPEGEYLKGLLVQVD